jgi:hypothetical protein
VTNGDLIRSLLLKPAVDASGVGGRGLAQVVSANGQILLTIIRNGINLPICVIE